MEFGCPTHADGSVMVEFKLASPTGTKAISAPPQAAPAPAPPAPAPPATLTELVSELKAAFEAEKALGHTIDIHKQPAESAARLVDKVKGLLAGYASSNTNDWQKYALFNSLHYVRNLVDCNEDFELIVLCWQDGQQSRVHNHADSHCWLAVLDGDMREVQYQVAAPPAGSELPPNAVYVEPTQTTDMKAGDCGYINDHLCLHTVGCPRLAEERRAAEIAKLAGPGGWVLEGGVTLHLYSPPIRRVKIYEDNKITERTPGFYSRGGVRV